MSLKNTFLRTLPHCFWPEEKRWEKIYAAISFLPEGQELLAAVRKKNIPIAFSKSLPNGIMGEIWRDSRKQPGVGILLNNRYPNAVCTLTLLHELRHVEQHVKLGLYKDGIDTLPEVQDGLFFQRATEGDAFVFQTLAVLKLKKAGRPEFFEAMMEMDMGEPVREFLKVQSFESFASDAAFCREFFFHVQEKMLGYYDDDFLWSASFLFRKSADAMEAREKLKNFSSENISAKALMPIATINGENYLAAMTPAQFQKKVMSAVTLFNRVTARYAEKGIAAAQALSEDGYNHYRRVVIDRMEAVFGC